MHWTAPGKTGLYIPHALIHVAEAQNIAHGAVKVNICLVKIGFQGRKLIFNRATPRLAQVTSYNILVNVLKAQLPLGPAELLAI